MTTTTMRVKQFNIEKVADIDKEKGTLRAVISSGEEDRHDERIDQTSWKLDNYLKNPVVLWGHDQHQPAIGKTLSIGIVDGMLEALIQFAIKEYDFAKVVFDLYAGGYMRAFSVGFIPGIIEIEKGSDILTLKDCELLEFSAVNVGADALALAKSKGVDVKDFDTAKKVDVKNLDTEEDPEEDDIEEEELERAKKAVDKAIRLQKKATSRKNQKYRVRRALNKAVRELIKAKN